MEDLTVIIDHKVSCIIVNDGWNFSKSLTLIPLSIQLCIQNSHISHDLQVDTRVWTHSYNEEFSTSRSCLVWKMMHDKISTNDQWKIRHFAFPSQCGLCNEVDGTSQNLFIHCKFASHI